MSSFQQYQDDSSGYPDNRHQQDWSQKLVGKKYVEDQAHATDSQSFTKESLPQPSRICKPGGLFTMDYNTERLNVHVNDNNVCTHVTMG